MTPIPAALELLEITKSFGTTRALSGAQFSVARGEVHALLGENGAGKSTLVGIAAGFLRPDSGVLSRNGIAVSFANPREAGRSGIALVPQHDRLVEAASVADNLALLDPSAPFLERPGARSDRVLRVAERFGLELGSPRDLVAGLPVGTRQRIGIAGALLHDPEVLILDEPTAVLSPDEAHSLFAALRKRAEAGGSVVVITHRINEVFSVADRLTLLSRGRTVKQCAIAETSREEIAGLFLGNSEGSEATEAGPRAHLPDEPGGTTLCALRIESFRPKGARSVPVSLTLEAGRLESWLAIDGNGADELAAAIAGVRNAEGGVTLHGISLRPGVPGDFRRAGGGFIPADRRAEGLVPDFSLAENLALCDVSGWLVDRSAARARANQLSSQFQIRGNGPDSFAATLSGGNQQKLLLARELSRSPRLLLAIHPTRGLDIGSTLEIRQRLKNRASEGGAVLVVTADPEEARALGGSIRVVYRGELSTPLGPEVPLEILGRRMAGIAA